MPAAARRRRPSAPITVVAIPSRKAPHADSQQVFCDGATAELRARVAYAICAAVYNGGCACASRKMDACSSMLKAASSAITITEEARPF